MKNIDKIIEATNLVIKQYDRLKKEETETGKITHLDYLEMAVSYEDSLIRRSFIEQEYTDLYDEIIKIINNKYFTPYTVYENRALVRILGILEFVLTDYTNNKNDDYMYYIFINYINYLRKLGKENYVNEKYDICMYNKTVENIYMDTDFEDIDLMPTANNITDFMIKISDVINDQLEEFMNGDLEYTPNYNDLLDSMLEHLDLERLEYIDYCIEDEYKDNKNKIKEIILNKVREKRGKIV